MSATELEPWKTCLKHLQTLNAYPYDEVELGLATNELTEIITNTLLSGAGSMSEAACRKLVNDKVFLAQSTPTCMDHKPCLSFLQSCTC